MLRITQLSYICGVLFHLWILCNTAVDSAPATKCQSGEVEHGNYCYSIHKKPRSLAHSDAECRSSGGQVVSVHSDDENQFITNLLKDTSRVWLGLIYQKNIYRWIDGSAVVYNRPLVTVTPTGHNSICFVLSVDQDKAVWQVTSCGSQESYICKREIHKETAESQSKQPYCPDGYFQAASDSDKCYKIILSTGEIDVGSSWLEARAECQQGPGTNPDIGSILTNADQAAVTVQLREDTWNIWIGYMYNRSDSTWYWIDGSTSTYENWIDGHVLGGDCCEMRGNRQESGRWISSTCTTPRGYLCHTYKDSGNPINTPPTTSHSCRSGWTPYENGCYRVVIDRKTWIDAEDDCSSQGGHLVSIEDVYTNSAMYVLANNDLPIWIGYYKDVDDQWKWSSGQAVTYTNFLEGSPSAESCTLMTSGSTGTWIDWGCEETMAYVCRISTGPVPTTPVYVNSRCPGDEWIEWGSSCYYFSSSTTGWDLAQQYCESVSTNLVSIHSDEENEFIFGNNVERFFNTWIGLRSQHQSGEEFDWQYTDGSPFDYNAWSMGEPNNPTSEYCVHMYADAPENIPAVLSLWNNERCNWILTYVCKYDKVPVSNVTTPRVPRYYLQHNASFSSSSGQDFNLECTQLYSLQINNNLATLVSNVNALLGTSLCVGLNANDMTILLGGSSLSTAGNIGVAAPYYILNTTRDLTIQQVDDCATEIDTYLGLYSNWPGGSVVNPEQNCPGADFSGTAFDNVNNQYICLGQTDEQKSEQLDSAFIRYGVSHTGEIQSTGGENINIQCVSAYSATFSVKVLSMVDNVNSLLASGQLCPDRDISITTVSPVFLTATGSQGTTYQRYQLNPGNTDSFTELTECAKQVSAYLGNHDNWQQPILEPIQNCPEVVFNPEVFLENRVEWICQQGLGTEEKDSQNNQKTTEQKLIHEAESKPSLMKREVVSCPSPDWQERGNDCYFFTNSSYQYTFDAAEAACQQAGGHLSSVADSDENSFIQAGISPQGPAGWIGHFKEGPAASWEWSDSTDVDYINWGPGEPNAPLTDFCAELWSDNGLHPGDWNDVSCSGEIPFVCKAPKSNGTAAQRTPPYYLSQYATLSSASGLDFTPECTSAYGIQMNSQAQQLSGEVNSKIGVDICLGVSGQQMSIVLSSCPFLTDGNVGETAPYYIISITSDLTLTQVHNCVSEINTYLADFTNWDPLSQEPDCPIVEFDGTSFTDVQNRYLCVGETQGLRGKEDSLALEPAFLNYRVGHMGLFSTEQGQTLTPECLSQYNLAFSIKTVNMAQEVNGLIPQLCNQQQTTVETVSQVYLTASNDEGTTSQRYVLQPGQDDTFDETYSCAQQISNYLADHINWGDSVIEPIENCPVLVFDPSYFLETGQEWICQDTLSMKHREPLGSRFITKDGGYEFNPGAP